MASNPPKGKITWDEIASKFPAVMDLVSAIQNGIAAANADGKLSGEEMGNLLAVVGPKLGKLVDQVIADAAD